MELESNCRGAVSRARPRSAGSLCERISALTVNVSHNASLLQESRRDIRRIIAKRQEARVERKAAPIQHVYKGDIVGKGPRFRSLHERCSQLYSDVERHQQTLDTHHGLIKEVVAARKLQAKQESIQASGAAERHSDTNSDDSDASEDSKTHMPNYPDPQESAAAARAAEAAAETAERRWLLFGDGNPEEAQELALIKMRLTTATSSRASSVQRSQASRPVSAASTCYPSTMYSQAGRPSTAPSSRRPTSATSLKARCAAISGDLNKHQKMMQEHQKYLDSIIQARNEMNERKAEDLSIRSRK